MTPEQRTRQKQAIVIDYKNKLRDGVLPRLNADERTSRLLWASDVTGRVISTLDACTDSELNALRDRLAGNDGKLLSRVRHEFVRLNVLHPDRWIAACAQGPRFRAWHGKTLEQLPVSQLYRLLKMLQAR